MKNLLIKLMADDVNFGVWFTIIMTTLTGLIAYLLGFEIDFLLGGAILYLVLSVLLTMAFRPDEELRAYDEKMAKEREKRWEENKNFIIPATLLAFFYFLFDKDE